MNWTIRSKYKPSDFKYLSGNENYYTITVAISRYRHRPFAHLICSIVLHSASNKLIDATSMLIHLARLVATFNPFSGNGLFLIPVNHEGNQSQSLEEVGKIRDIISHLLSAGLTWTNREGKTSPLEEKDILVIAPYNAQVSVLKEALPQISVGTVDKFQGQEAPVVIYSMTSSSPQDAPRGMSFLYSPNRYHLQ